jgi:hypothetical protein
MPLLSDRTKRGLILRSTAALPWALRVRARAALLGRLELGKARRAAYFIIGHPKSGNTWLRTMISRLYQVRYGLPASTVLKSDELAIANPEIPRFCVANGQHSYEGVLKRAFSDPASALRTRKVLLLARHPCDVAVSWYLQFTRRISNAKRELINAGLHRPVDWKNVSRWDFIMKTEIGLEGIIDFLNDWQRIVSGLEQGKIVRYEDLRERTEETLAEIVTFFGLPFSQREIDEAVSFGSFENLRKLESAGFFRHGGLALVRPDDPESRKVRRGKVGGYREDLTPAEAAEMERIVARRLSPVFGYGSGSAAADSAEEAG